jgi:hypothetical protein
MKRPGKVHFVVMHRAGTLIVSAIVLLSLAGSAQAQSLASPAPTCPAGNLMARARVFQSTDDIRGGLARVTDGVVAPEGAIWDATPAVIMDTGAASITWDLGMVVSARAAWVQADANDTYTLWGSVDGTTFADLGRVEIAEGVHGLRGRKLSLGGMPIRFLRFGEGVGDGFYSVSELQLFCEIPTPFPPSLRVENAPVATVKKDFYYYWNNETSARWEFVLAVLGLGLLQWGYQLRRQGRPLAFKRLRDWLLAIGGVLGALTYVNFGFGHFGNLIHDWEWTHYYVGSKYFKELSYDRLYECIGVADIEEGLRKRVELRKVTNLRTNALEPSTDIVKYPERCKQHFSPERWESFKHDVRFFRDRHNAKRWDELQTDHGYNGTPVWNVAGSLLANTAPASKTQLYILALLDPLYLAGCIAVIWWAFGWRVLSVALLVFATNFPSRYYWTGGAFLRWDWLFYLVAAICCLKKNRPMLGGAVLAYSTLLRVFPGFIFVGPALALAWGLYKHRRLEPRYTRFFVGAAIATVLLVPLSLKVSGGVGAYQRFVQNTIKHKETPLTNYMGLRTVVAWRPSEVGRLLKDEKLTDPWGKWKEARLKGARQALPLTILVVGGFLVLLGMATRHVEPWAAAALGITFIPLGAELTCYYYAFIMGVALLHEKREEVGRWLLLLTAFTQFVAWAPLRGMARWLDEQYTLMSVATLVVFGLIVWLFREPATDVANTVETLPQSRSQSPQSGLPAVVPNSGATSSAAGAPASISDRPTRSGAGKGRQGRRRR